MCYGGDKGAGIISVLVFNIWSGESSLTTKVVFLITKVIIPIAKGISLIAKEINPITKGIALIAKEINLITKEISLVTNGISFY